jgi:hypothetical protein
MQQVSLDRLPYWRPSERSLADVCIVHLEYQRQEEEA